VWCDILIQTGRSAFCLVEWNKDIPVQEDQFGFTNGQAWRVLHDPNYLTCRWHHQRKQFALTRTNG